MTQRVTGSVHNHIDIMKYEVCQVVRVHVSQWFPVTVSLLEVTQHSSIRCMHRWREEGEDKNEGGRGREKPFQKEKR